MSAANRGIDFGPPRFKIAAHAVVWLAKSGGVVSSAMIAGQVDSHATFLRRVMQILTGAGIVESRGGREGGYRLARKPAEITLGAIYDAMGAALPETDEHTDCEQASAALDAELERILLEAERHTVQYLNRFTIADVMSRVDFFNAE